MNAPFEPYNLLLADPPWEHGAWRPGSGNGLAASHYRCLSTDAICALDGGLARVTAPRTVLFLWATSAMLPDALRVMAAWGFHYRCVGFVWVKLSPKPLAGRAWRDAVAAGKPIHTYQGQPYLLAFGNGHYTRSGAEFCLLGTRVSSPVASRSERQVIVAPRGRHSAKPDEQYERIEAMFPGRRYLELFARRRRNGWAAWGDELVQTEGTTHADP